MMFFHRCDSCHGRRSVWDILRIKHICYFCRRYKANCIKDADTNAVLFETDEFGATTINFTVYFYSWARFPQMMTLHSAQLFNSHIPLRECSAYQEMIFTFGMDGQLLKVKVYADGPMFQLCEDWDDCSFTQYDGMDINIKNVCHSVLAELNISTKWISSGEV